MQLLLVLPILRLLMVFPSFWLVEGHNFEVRHVCPFKSFKIRGKAIYITKLISEKKSN